MKTPGATESLSAFSANLKNGGLLKQTTSILASRHKIRLWLNKKPIFRSASPQVSAALQNLGWGRRRSLNVVLRRMFAWSDQNNGRELDASLHLESLIGLHLQGIRIDQSLEEIVEMENLLSAVRTKRHALRNVLPLFQRTELPQTLAPIGLKTELFKKLLLFCGEKGISITDLAIAVDSISEDGIHSIENLV